MIKTCIHVYVQYKQMSYTNNSTGVHLNRQYDSDGKPYPFVGWVLCYNKDINESSADDDDVDYDDICVCICPPCMPSVRQD